MITSRQRIQTILSIGLLASATFSASAQTPSTVNAAGTSPISEHRMNKQHESRSAEYRQERRAKFLAELKTKLQITTSQEAAWTAFTGASQSTGRTTEHKDPETMRADFDKLTTPQRLDRMQARQEEHAVVFARRADATRAFYAGLTPAQQKTFDTQSLRHDRHAHGEHGPRGPRG